MYLGGLHTTTYHVWCNQQELQRGPEILQPSWIWSKNGQLKLESGSWSIVFLSCGASKITEYMETKGVGGMENMEMEPENNTGSAREWKQRIRAAWREYTTEHYIDLANLIRTHHTSVQHITSCLITGPGALSDGNSNLVVLEMEHAW